MTLIAGYNKVSASVFEGEDDPVVVTRDAVQQVIEAAKQAPNGRARLILHDGAQDNLHEMVIALPATSCDHPHINFRSGKSFLALSGLFAVMHFSDDGSQITPIVLDADEKRGAVMTRLRGAAWHTIIPMEGDTAFLETNLGPFTGNQFAPWFPPEGPERDAYADDLRARARRAAVL